MVVKHWLADHPFTTCTVWLIVTCYGWGAAFAVSGVELWVAMFFGFAWSLCSWFVIEEWSTRVRRD